MHDTGIFTCILSEFKYALCKPPLNSMCLSWIENQAVYFCSGDLTPPEFHHYGLAAPLYTHFTSPIRRYAGQ